MKVRFALVARGIASAPPLEDQQAGDDAEQEPRHDAAEMAAYLVRFSGEVPTRELAVYEAYYLRRLSKQETSAALGISVNTVGTLLLRLRTRARTTAGR